MKSVTRHFVCNSVLLSATRALSIKSHDITQCDGMVLAHTSPPRPIGRAFGSQESHQI